MAAGPSWSAAHCPLVCNHLSLCQCSRSQRLAQRVPERLAEVCGLSPHARPVWERLPACGLRATGRAHLATWRGGGAASRGLHNPEGACPTRLWHNSVCNAYTRGVLVLLVRRTREMARLVLARSADLPVDVNLLLRAACARLGGRGGGKSNLAPGGGRALPS
jgi:DHHA1 domain